MKENSFLRKPPINLDAKQVIAINALSFSIDICEMAFEELVNELLLFSNNPKSEKLIFPKIFSNVWTIINNSSLFRNILEKHFEVSIEENYMQELNITKKIRNTNQHIEERINEILTLETLPIYGSLSWYRNIKNTNKVEQFFLYSGVFTNIEKVGGEMIAPKKEKTNRIIDEIIFSSVTKLNKNDYPILTISLYKIMEDMNFWVEYLESEIAKNLEGIENIERHKTNLYAKIKSHWEE